MSAYVLIAEIVLSVAVATAQSKPDASQAENYPPGNGVPQEMSPQSHCAALSYSDPGLAPIATVCQFAASYRRSLPDFICEQTTVSAGGLGHIQRVMRARVTYEKGKETYSDVVINGRSVDTHGAAPLGLYRISTAGEFGSDLVGLFTPPVLAEFSFRKAATLQSHPALLFDFHLPASKNTFWTVGSRNGSFNPEVRGELWLEPQSARLLRMTLEPLHLPAEFPIATAKTTIDYGEVRLGEAGDFLLPIRSESRACMQQRRFGDDGCMHNVITFHNCRKFTAKVRIVGEPQIQR